MRVHQYLHPGFMRALLTESQVHMELILQSPHILINTSLYWQTHFIKCDIQGLRQTLLWLSLRNWESQRCRQSSQWVPCVLPSGLLFTKLIFNLPLHWQTWLSLERKLTPSGAAAQSGRWGCLPHSTAMSGDPGTTTRLFQSVPGPTCVLTAHTFLDFIPSLPSSSKWG